MGEIRKSPQMPRERYRLRKKLANLKLYFGLILGTKTVYNKKTEAKKFKNKKHQTLVNGENLILSYHII